MPRGRGRGSGRGGVSKRTKADGGRAAEAAKKARASVLADHALADLTGMMSFTDAMPPPPSSSSSSQPAYEPQRIDLTQEPGGNGKELYGALGGFRLWRGVWLEWVF
jgi:hypothetical protein